MTESNITAEITGNPITIDVITSLISHILDLFLRNRIRGIVITSDTIVIKHAPDS